jgi:hypothetical protein
MVLCFCFNEGFMNAVMNNIKPNRPNLKKPMAKIERLRLQLQNLLTI